MKWKIRILDHALLSRHRDPLQIFTNKLGHMCPDVNICVPLLLTELHEHVKLSRVWQTCQHGPSIALDEMNFIIRQVAHATDCVNLGAWTVDEVFDREVLSLFEEPMEQTGKVAALPF